MFELLFLLLPLIGMVVSTPSENDSAPPEGEAGDLEILKGDEDGGETKEDKEGKEPEVTVVEKAVDEEEGGGAEEKQQDASTLEEEDEVFEEEPTIYPRPSFKEVTGKYPNLFKDFPNLRQAFFREREFTERFPTVEDADEALQKSQNLDAVTEAISTGNVTTLLDSMESDDIKKVAGNFLPSLYKKDQELYFAITGPLVDQLIKTAYKEAVASGNEDLQHSAEWFAKWALGDIRYATGEAAVQPLRVKADPERQKLEQERKEFYQQKFTEAQSVVINTATSRIIKEIESGIGDGVSPKMRQMISKEVLSEVADALAKDQRHISQMHALWKRAEKSGYSGEHRARIIATYLARAKALIPSVRSRIKREVLGQETQNNSEPAQSTTRIVSGGAPSISKSVGQLPRDPKRINWDKTSDLDLIRGKAVLKR